MKLHILLPPLAALLLSSCATPVVMQPGAFSTVVIDAGHGGKDNGGRSRTGLAEKNMALDTAQRLRPLLENAGFRTVMTRTGDYFVELNDRVNLANRYPNAVLVSVHYNASPSKSSNGVETFFWRPDSFGLATRVENQLAATTGMDRRGATRRVLRLTRNPRIPAILCECGFLTNGGESSRIADAGFRQKVAEAIADGIVTQRERGDVGFAYLPPVQNDSVRRSRHASSRHKHHATRIHHRRKRR